MSEKLGVRLTPATMATLVAIEKRHGHAPGVVARKLLDAACEFYEANGFFSFPVVIEPLAFQASYVAEKEAQLEQRARGSRAKRGGPAKE